MDKLKLKKGSVAKIQLSLVNNHHALNATGPAESHLTHLKDELDVSIKMHGFDVTIEGPEEQAKIAEKCLLHLRDSSIGGMKITHSDVADCLRAFQQDVTLDFNQTLKNHTIISVKKRICPRTLSQKKYVEGIEAHDLVFGVGPAGTGKTYLAVAVGMAKLLKGEVDRIILTRPAVEAGEKLGFLPGDMAEKVNPYLRPLLDALHEMLDYERVEKMLATGQIEIAPIAFMRGRTLNDSYVILDEAQNCTREQMKMFLTRIGENSMAVVTGDVTQIDLPQEKRSGLIQALKILSGIKGIYIHKFTDVDVVRHPLVREIVKAYDSANKIP